MEQKSLEQIAVYMVLSGALSERSKQLIRIEIAKVFGDGTVVSLDPVESIPKRASGKRRVTIGLQGAQ